MVLHIIQSNINMNVGSGKETEREQGREMIRYSNCHALAQNSVVCAECKHGGYTDQSMFINASGKKKHN